MKCLPASKVIQANGTVLHDTHAEIVAIRSFNYFLINECQDLLRSGLRSSTFIRRRDAAEISDEHFQPFAVKDDTRIHMYSSEAPCGDASMELVMERQEDATPWAVSGPSPRATSSEAENSPEVPSSLHGRGYFSELGIVRRKPSRPDAPPTNSKSCSDKLSHMTATSLLLSPTALLIHPTNAYLSTLILPSSQHSPLATHRAFSATGRLSPLSDVQSNWKGGYKFQPFEVRTTSREFEFSRRGGGGGGGGGSDDAKGAAVARTRTPSNLSVAYTPRFQETLIGGVLQGRRQFDPRGASRVCKRGIWRAVAEAVALFQAAGGAILANGGSVAAAGRRLQTAFPSAAAGDTKPTYEEALKASPLLAARRAVKDDVRSLALKGWRRNGGNAFVIGE
ncbi:MAG: hypothetical protein M1819_006123 [Sarea resinae]|nr:MAG: hypothetical protein M1819_006123 [Sarea resinae]